MMLSAHGSYAVHISDFEDEVMKQTLVIITGKLVSLI